MRLAILTAGVLTVAMSGCTTMQPATMPAVATGESCKLSPDELAARRKELIPGLFTRAEKVTDIPNGLRFQFANAPRLLSDLSHVIEHEQDCCSFLEFPLTTTANAGPVTFDVTGPAGTGEMLRKL